VPKPVYWPDFGLILETIAAWHICCSSVPPGGFKKWLFALHVNQLVVPSLSLLVLLKAENPQSLSPAAAKSLLLQLQLPASPLHPRPALFVAKAAAKALLALSLLQPAASVLVLLACSDA